MTLADAAASLQHLTKCYCKKKPKPTYKEVSGDSLPSLWHNTKHTADKPAVAHK